MAYLSRWDLEQIAYRVTQAYARKVGVKYADLDRVVPETVLQDVLGLRIQYEHLSLDGNTLGITGFDDTEVGVYDDGQEGDMVKLDGKTVLIERDLLYYDKTGRRNFTLLHEGGHHVLFMLFPKEYATGSPARTVKYYREQKSDGFNPLEWQCDTLAAAILMRKGLKADERLPFEDLYFAGKYGNRLSRQNAGVWSEALEMARWAPSAGNRQPCRAVVDGERVHFYENKTLKDSALGDIQKVDVGIALAHFDLTAQEEGYTGRFFECAPETEIPDHVQYIISYERTE